ncbi:MAG: hypothetical protein KAT05_05150, partial [Spirochaetes bacterium]|nr:hypothetical protein [Spirochaetota bacterium]
MVSAFIIIPVYIVIYIFNKEIDIKKRIAHLIITGIIVITVSFSYAIVVDLFPGNKRPFIANTTNNSMMELIFVHNGLTRLSKDKAPNQKQNRPPKLINNKNLDHLKPKMRKDRISEEVGAPSLLRLFNNKLSYQINFYIVFIIIGTILFFKKIKYFSLVQKNFFYLFFSFAVILILYFSLNSGVFHRYYLSLLAPPFAVLTGISFSLVYRSFTENKKRFILPISLLLVLITEMFISLYSINNLFLPLVITSIMFAASATVFIINEYYKKNIIFSKLPVIFMGVSLLVIPFCTSITPMIYGGNSVIPYAGTSLKTDPLTSKNIKNFNGMYKNIDSISNFLLKNYNNEKFIAAVPSCNYYGSTLVLATKKSVCSIGGFSGHNFILTLEEIKDYVKNNYIRYFIIPENSLHTFQGHGPTPESLPLEMTNWIIENGKIIPQ